MLDIERVRKVIDWIIFEKLAKNRRELASLIGYTESSLSQIVNSKVPLSDIFIKKLSIVDSRINESWLLTGKGDMLKGGNPKWNEVKPIDPNYIEVPLISVKAQAGYLSGFNDAVFIDEQPKVQVHVDRTFHGKYRCFEVSGDSMDDGMRNAICDGDTILGREVKRDLWCYKLHLNKWYFVINHIGGLLVKQIVDHDVESGIITCHSLNPLYGHDFKLKLDEVREIYNVIKIVDRVLRF